MNAATTSFETTTGFSLSSVATWMWTVLLEPILGGGLAIVYTLRYYLIAIAMILIIVYFAKRAWGAWHQ